MLVECDEKWGDDELRAGFPPVETHRNVVYMPLGHVPLHLDPQWGLYHQDGRLLDIGAYRRGSEKALVGQSYFLPEQAIAASARLTGTYIYGGVGFTHYGHFMTAMLARLWHVWASAKPNAKIVFHSHGNADNLMSFSFVRDVMSAIGVERSDIIILSESPSEKLLSLLNRL